MAEDVPWDREAIVAAQPNRYEVMEISYKMIETVDGPKVDLDISSSKPVIAWRIFRSSIAPGLISVPIGPGFTMCRADDWYSSKSEGLMATDRSAAVWFDRQTQRFHCVSQSGEGRYGWQAVCKSAINDFCNSDALKDEREGRTWIFAYPSEWGCG